MIKKILFFIFIILILISSFLYYKNTNNISSNISLLVIDDSKEKNILHLVLLKYLPKNKELKILFIDKNITIIQQKVKSRSLVENYYLQKENNIQFVQSEIDKIFNSNIKIYNYIVLNIDTFISMLDILNTYKEFPFLIDSYKENLLNSKEYLETVIYNMKFSKYILLNINRFSFVKLLRFLNSNKNNIKTNIQNEDLLKIYLAIRSIKNISFADIPIINRRNRLEINKEFIEQTSNSFFNESYNCENNTNVKVEVLNASKKQRLALKVVDELRNNKFDVFEWGSYNKSCDYTLIFDFGNNRESTTKLKNLIGCGEVLCRTNNKPFADISIILGKDCNVVDKLDKIK